MTGPELYARLERLNPGWAWVLLNDRVIMSEDSLAALIARAQRLGLSTDEASLFQLDRVLPKAVEYVRQNHELYAGMTAVESLNAGRKLIMKLMEQ